MSGEASETIAEIGRDGATAIAVLEERARTMGGKTFVTYGEDGVSLTYAEVADTAAAIASNLGSIGEGRRVSLLTRNSLVSLLWMFGIWRARGVYCPINFNYRDRLLAYQLDDTEPGLLIVDRELVPAVNEVASELRCRPRVAIHDPAPGTHDAVAEPVALKGLTEVAYEELVTAGGDPGPLPAWHEHANIIYTSGTTGPSKGVVQAHRWLDQYTWAGRSLLTEDDVLYNDLPLYHVGGAIFNIVRAAWAGASVSLWDRFSSSTFWARIHDAGATSAVLLDVMIPWLMNAPESPEDRVNPLNKAHMQPLPLHHRQVAERFGIDFVTAGFGQSEAGGPLFAVLEETAEGAGTPAELYRGLSHAEVRAVAERKGFPLVDGATVTRKGYMGRPLPFVDVAVLDEHDTPCPPGRPGELALRPLMPGLLLDSYRGKPEATAHALRNVWFHTGDSALMEEDGSYVFVDRLGDRIRRRGENISSFHVEDLVNQHEAVRATAVVGVPSIEGDEDEIVAFVEADATQDELETWIAEHLPQFMRPDAVRLLDDLPRTPTNKVEKYRLKKEFVENREGPGS